jgi:hypothetical protein
MQYIRGAEHKKGAEPVQEALRSIQNRIATTLGKHIYFNEVLSTVFVEKQKMAVSGSPVFW